MIDINEDSTLIALEKAVAETFEGIAFAQILDKRALTAPPILHGETISAYIDLKDPVNLRFFMMMTLEHAMECFESVAPGMDTDDVENAILTDFVLELTNTAAGHFTSSLAPEKKDMSIGLPMKPTSAEIRKCITPSTGYRVMFYQIEAHELICSISIAPQVS